MAKAHAYFEKKEHINKNTEGLPNTRAVATITAIPTITAIQSAEQPTWLRIVGNRREQKS